MKPIVSIIMGSTARASGGCRSLNGAVLSSLSMMLRRASSMAGAGRGGLGFWTGNRGNLCRRPIAGRRRGSRDAHRCRLHKKQARCRSRLHRTRCAVPRCRGASGCICRTRHVIWWRCRSRCCRRCRAESSGGCRCKTAPAAPSAATKEPALPHQPSPMFSHRCSWQHTPIAAAAAMKQSIHRGALSAQR